MHDRHLPGDISAGRFARFAVRVLQDAVAEASADQWLRRAQVFDAAAHRPGIDWPGQATPEELAAQQARCRSVALWCRIRADIERGPVIASWDRS